MDVRIAQLEKNIGVTRLANVTGLDRIGLPVVAAVRPLSRNITVSFGKGKTYENACLSAVMEAAELFYSESCRFPSIHATYLELGSQAALNPLQLALPGSPKDVLLRKYNWVSGFNLRSGDIVLVPWEIISMDYSVVARAEERVLVFGPTGLAAAFEEPCAILHGLYEVIERDCHAKWNTISDAEREATRVDLTSIADPDTLKLLDDLNSVHLEVLLWDMTGACGIACYLAEIIDFETFAHTKYSHGAATDILPHRAIYRAFCEAAQVRLTYISGSRDDLDHSDYGRNFDELAANREWVSQSLTSLRKIPPLTKDQCCVSSNLDCVCELLRQRGIDDVIVVRLTSEKDNVAVVKVVVPSLNDVHDLETQRQTELVDEDVFA